MALPEIWPWRLPRAAVTKIIVPEIDSAAFGRHLELLGVGEGMHLALHSRLLSFGRVPRSLWSGAVRSMRQGLAQRLTGHAIPRREPQRLIMRTSYDSLHASAPEVLLVYAADPRLDTRTLDDDLDLLQSGVLDSLAFLNFVQGVQERTSTAVELATLGDLEFSSIRTFAGNALGIPKD